MVGHCFEIFETEYCIDNNAIGSCVILLIMILLILGLWYALIQIEDKNERLLNLYLSSGDKRYYHAYKSKKVEFKNLVLNHPELKDKLD